MVKNKSNYRYNITCEECGEFIKKNHKCKRARIRYNKFHCRKYLPYNEFQRDCTKRYGINTCCKKCRIKYKINNPIKIIKINNKIIKNLTDIERRKRNIQRLLNEI